MLRALDDWSGAGVGRVAQIVWKELVHTGWEGVRVGTGGGSGKMGESGFTGARGVEVVVVGGGAPLPECPSGGASERRGVAGV